MKKSTRAANRAICDAGRSYTKLHTAQLEKAIRGQPGVAEAIIPFLTQYKAGLNPEGRPAGTFLLLGPTGTGKTHTVEALAEVIHGSKKNILRIDCAEFQSDHEVAKMIGAPPGYLGHRETQPAFTQMKINQAMSDRANLAIVLFDEIEKAAPTIQRLLLGILDKGTLTLGDNTRVSFERTFVFFTSNLGAAEMQKRVGPQFGLSGGDKPLPTADDLAPTAIAAVSRHFSPEFVNRIDRKIVYNFLTEADLYEILELELQAASNHIGRRLGDRAFFLRVPRATKKYLINLGYDPRYGARHLKRIIQSEIIFPASQLFVDGELEPGDVLDVVVVKGKLKLIPCGGETAVAGQ